MTLDVSCAASLSMKCTLQGRSALTRLIKEAYDVHVRCPMESSIQAIHVESQTNRILCSVRCGTDVQQVSQPHAPNDLHLYSHVTRKALRMRTLTADPGVAEDRKRRSGVTHGLTGDTRGEDAHTNSIGTGRAWLR